MGLTMDKILNKFDDCNKFSLTGGFLEYIFTNSQEEPKIEKYNITEEEFLNAIKKIEEQTKEKFKKTYENMKEKFIINYQNFDELYDELKQKCYDCQENNKSEEEILYRFFY